MQHKMHRLVAKTLSQCPAIAKSSRGLHVLCSPRSGSHPSSEPVPKIAKAIPEIVFFHNPAMLRSVKLLALLRDAQTAFPRSRFRTGPPLELKIEVLERLPTIQELQEMFSFITEPSWSIFRAHNTPNNYRHHITGVRSLMDTIEQERQEKIASMPRDNAAVTEPPPPPPDTLAPMSSLTLPPKYDVAVLDASHPLFGTDGFAWPVMICWAKKLVLVFPQSKEVHRLLKSFANERDDIVVKTKEQLKEEATEAWRATWTYPEKQVSPDEDDTLKWFNESSERPVQRRTW